MEDNISDALTMAGSVLLFVIGLSVCMLAFSQARIAIDTVLSYSDRETSTIEGDARYYYLSNRNDTNRYVGKETIIPAIYRAYKENFKVVFKFKDNSYYLFTKEVKESNGVTNTKKIKTIDLQNQLIGNDLASRQFLDGIIYGKWSDKIPGNGTPKEKYEKYFNIIPNTTSLYEYLNNHTDLKIKESLGTYYLNDLNNTSIISDVDKTERRVITYEFI